MGDGELCDTRGVWCLFSVSLVGLEWVEFAAVLAQASDVVVILRSRSSSSSVSEEEAGRVAEQARKRRTLH